MATLQETGYYANVDMREYTVGSKHISVQNALVTPTKVEWTSPSDNFVFEGNDFSVVNGQLNDGTISAVRSYTSDGSFDLMVTGINLPVSVLVAQVNSGDTLGWQQYAFSGDDLFTGTSQGDYFLSTPGNDTIDGGTGVDTAAYSNARAGYTITKTTSGNTVSGPEGADTLTNIERLKFSDKSVALDMATNQSGGETALLLGAVLPGTLALDASKQSLLGSVISLFDAGYSMKDLSGAVLRLPIWDALTGQATPTNTDIANYLLTNVNGNAPDQATLAAAVNALNTESFQGDWLASLALSTASQTHIGLVGLQQTGLEYV